MARKLLYSLFFLSFLLSMHFWFGWEGRAKYINWIIAILSLSAIYVGKIKLCFSFRNIGMFLLVLLAHILALYSFGYSSILFFLIYFLIICLNDSDKIRCLQFITKWFGYLMIPSLIFYGLFFITDLPSFGIQRANLNDWAIEKGYGVCQNYLFYMRSPIESYKIRFNGPFLEPGHVGMIAAFLLLVNQFDFKRKGMWPILIAIIFTLSLAGYVLAFLSFLMILFYKKKIQLKYLLIYSFLFLVVYLFGMYYNGGDNILYEKIFSRLETDNEKGFTGNNRVFGLIDIYFAALWNDTQTMLWGYSKEIMEWLAENNSRGTGYIMWMCQHGIIGTIAVALIYIFNFIYSKARLFAGICLIFVVLMFWQRSYPFWTSWIICYVYGIASEENNLIRKANENRNSYISSKP